MRTERGEKEEIYEAHVSLGAGKPKTQKYHGGIKVYVYRN